ncbi:cupin 2 domain-containing protein (plasmid) [Rhizobium gallicum]|uniref:Cupin 2 domain-containing protein n=1 Tax=Rhizobium gallicum TaxID=56730 RepID=A0A1L5NT91_9HYPH|nr:cupin 2 domain-containing protein [Rhizobium gallicum]
MAAELLATMEQKAMIGIETIVLQPVRDIGDGSKARRALPSQHRYLVGPFVVFEQIGAAEFRAGHGLDVPLHPHIGLATVTYLIDGEILHRDRLGEVQTIYLARLTG